MSVYIDFCIEKLEDQETQIPETEQQTQGT